MSAVMKQEDQLPAMSEAALVEVLSSSLYPGAEKNMDLEVWCACRSEKGMPNADGGFYCNRGHGGAYHCAP